MANSDTSKEDRETELEHIADDVFSSEKREDIWAILIAVAILILSFAFPEQIYHFFKKGLYLF